MKILDNNSHFLIFMDRDQWFNRNLQAIKDLPPSERRWWKEKGAWYVSNNVRNEVLAFQISHRAEMISSSAEVIGELDPMPELEVEAAVVNATLRPYQTQGVAYVLQKKRTINGDDMGLGKTIQTIVTIATAHKEGHDVFPALIICPASLKENWKREIEKFTNYKALILSDKTRNNWKRYFELGMAQFFIVNYESLKKYFVQSWPKTRVVKSSDITMIREIEVFKTIVIDEVYISGAQQGAGALILGARDHAEFEVFGVFPLRSLLPPDQTDNSDRGHDHNTTQKLSADQVGQTGQRNHGLP